MKSFLSIIKGMSAYALIPAISAVFSLILLPVITNVYPTADYGKINIFYTLGTILSTIFSLGADNAYLRFSFKAFKALSKQLMLIVSFIVSIGLDVAVFILLIFICPELISALIFGESSSLALVLLGMYVASLVILRFANAVARAEGHVVQYGVQQILQNLFGRVLFVVCAVFTTSFLPAVGVIAVGTMLTAIFALVTNRSVYLKRVEKPTVSKREIKVFYSFAVPTMFATLLALVNNSVGKLILSSSGMMSEAGIVAVAGTLAAAFTIVQQGFSLYWGPFVYKNYRDSQSLISQTHDLVMAIIVLLVVIVMLGEDILFLLIGNAYGDSQALFLLFMLAPISVLITETTCYGALISDKPKYLTIVSAISTCVNIATTLIFLPFCGAYAAALGVLVSSLILVILKSVIGNYYYRTITHPLRSAVMCGIIYFLCISNSIVYTMPTFKVSIACAALFVVGLCYRKTLMQVVKSRAR